MSDLPIAFAGCDYLGLARDPRVAAAAADAIRVHGLSAGASPATTGRLPVHVELERALADLVGAEDAACVSGGALANLAALEALAHARAEPVGPVWIDPRAHTSLRAAARAAGLHAIDDRARARHVLVDGVYPSRGEASDLTALRADLAPGGVLVVDDSHGLGVNGPGGRGSAAAAGIELDERALLTTSLSKAIGAGGAGVAGSADWIAEVRATDAYVGSTALSPPLAAGAVAAIAVLRAEPQRLERLHAHVAALTGVLRTAGVQVSALGFPVLAVTARDPEGLREALRSAGFDAPVVRYPDGVAADESAGYLRLSLSAAHSTEDVARLADTLARLLR